MSRWPEVVAADVPVYHDPMAVSVEHIVITPETCGGRPRIAGTRIRVQDVYVWRFIKGMTIEEILEQYPQLSHGDVHAALAFYYDHREEMESACRQDLASAERWKSSEPSLLRETAHRRGETIDQARERIGRRYDDPISPG